MTSQRLFLARLAIGLVQGLALYWLYRAQSSQPGRIWPATDGLVFAPLLVCWLFIPPLLSSALGEMRPRRALAWAAAATVVMAGLAFHDNWTAWPVEMVFEAGRTIPRSNILPSYHLFIFGGAGLFIAHALIVGGHADGRFRASYATLFDIAWKLALQIALVVCFTGAFWLLLWLGAGLFSLIHLNIFKELLQEEWFAIPALSMAAGVALHLTDIRPTLVRGARTLALSLLSWLLPMPALIVAGFLASLPFTGLAALWDTGHAAALLLTASAALLILINAAHQDGDTERTPPRLLRVAGTVAALLPLPLTLIAAYALFLRVAQYGWTTDRVMVAACMLVSATYATGYAAAALRPGPWLQRIENWNFTVSLLVLAVLLALFTPLANPKRIAVANQMARLERGVVTPQAFDFAFLRREGGRYGMTALKALANYPDKIARDTARAQLTDKFRHYESRPPSTQDLKARITVFPKGLRLPESFYARAWQADANLPACIFFTGSACRGTMLDLNQDGIDEIVLIQGVRGYVFRQDGTLVANFMLPSQCDISKLGDGAPQAAEPHRAWNDIVIGGVQVSVQALAQDRREPCPAVQAEKPRDGR